MCLSQEVGVSNIEWLSKILVLAVVRGEISGEKVARKVNRNEEIKGDGIEGCSALEVYQKPLCATLNTVFFLPSASCTHSYPS